MELHPRGDTGKVDVHLETVEEMQDFGLYGLRRLSPTELRAAMRIYGDLNHHHYRSTVTLPERNLVRIGERLLDQADQIDSPAQRDRIVPTAELCRSMGRQIVDYTAANPLEGEYPRLDQNPTT